VKTQCGENPSGHDFTKVPPWWGNVIHFFIDVLFIRLHSAVWISYCFTQRTLCFCSSQFETTFQDSSSFHKQRPHKFNFLVNVRCTLNCR
jgi:hypothetical protein